MKVTITDELLKQHKINPTMYCILYCLYNKLSIDFIYTEDDLKYLEEKLFVKIVGDDEDIFLRDKALKMFEPKKSGFEAFWTTYPIKVGVGTQQRVLRSKDMDTKQGKECKIKYNKIITENPGVESKILLGLKKELAFRVRSNSLPFMQNVETYLNQRTYEKYYDLDIEVGDNLESTEKVQGI